MEMEDERDPRERTPASELNTGDIADEDVLDYDDDASMDGGARDVEESLLDQDPMVNSPPNDLARLKRPASKERSVSRDRGSSVTGEIRKTMSKTRLSSVVNDDVFTDPYTKVSCHRPAGSLGYANTDTGPQDEPPVFPPIYNIIRARKKKEGAAVRLGDTFGTRRKISDSSVAIQGGFLDTKDKRNFRAQNYHCTEKNLNVSFSVAKPDSGATDGIDCLACTDPHSFYDRMANKGLPVLIVMSDQNFPAILPAKEGLCPIIVRVEDGTMADLLSVFYERFKAFVSPHGTLPPGSVILIGSLSHLVAKGLEDYCECVASAAYGLTGKVGRNVEVVPLVPIPLHGMGGGSVVRDLFDFDGWLAGNGQTLSTSLGATRSVFWEIVRGEGEKLAVWESRTTSLPIGLKNKRKRPFQLDPPENPLPTYLRPIGTDIEAKIVSAMLCELNSVFGMGLDTSPDLCRALDPVPCIDSGRVIVIGGSHMVRVAAELDGIGCQVANLAVSGWVATQQNIEETTLRLGSLEPCGADIVLMDILSNSIYMGSDENGFPTKPVKLNKDRKYHVVGDLQIAPEKVIQKILIECGGLLEAVKDAGIMFLSPFPRYVTGRCCDDASHISNFDTDGYMAEIEKVPFTVKAAVSKCVRLGKAVILCLEDQLADTDLARGIADASCWADPVHLARAGYREVAGIIAAMVAEHPGGEPAPKRIRLDSVVPGNNAGPVNRGRVTLPAWVIGKAPARGTQRSWNSRGGRGRGMTGGARTRNGNFQFSRGRPNPRQRGRGRAGWNRGYPPSHYN